MLEQERVTGTTTVTKKEARALRARMDTLENRKRTTIKEEEPDKALKEGHGKK
jgi:hypothetical protein